VDLRTPLTRALGPRSAKPLAEGLGLHTAADLLRHYPRRYVERGQLTGFAGLEVGEHATVLAEVVSAHGRQLRPKLHKTDVVVRDETGARMKMAIFNRYQAERDLRAGRQAFFAGKVERFAGTVQLANPVYQLVDDDQGAVVEEFAGALVPIYPATARFDTFKIAKAVRVVLDVVDVGADPVPPELREAHVLLGLSDALTRIHRPRDRADVGAAERRLRWDEALVLQVVLAQRRAAAQVERGVARTAVPGGLLDAFDAATPFELTAGQRTVGTEIAGELARAHPMHRLLQGEVGSGKTLVALRAMLTVLDSGGQAALLAPTEVLAQQHARSLREVLGPLARAGELDGAPVATRVALLTGSLGAAARRSALAEAADGTAGIVVGTHALLSEGVEFADLGLVVVDEQHRFGVEQRDALRAKGTAPHVLVMTATPIPRTVAMTVYGDLDVSTLRELPRGRSPLTTHVVPARERPLARTWEKVQEEVRAGRQAFVVCPRIGDESGPDGDEPPPEEGDRRPAAAVLEVVPLLREGPLAGLRVEALHGRLPADVKDDTMRRFGRGEVDVLVATTVIEVGVDVPRATVMVVLDADRFGVSQLHQLRGRVGRGSDPGLCVLVTEVDADSPAGERLRAVASTSDGFALSQVDLEQRREGDVLGARQSGRRSSLRLLTLKHEDVIAEARTAARALVAADPALERSPALRTAVTSVLDEERAAFLEKG